MYACPDPPHSQLTNEIRTVDPHLSEIQPQNVQMPRVAVSRIVGWQFQILDALKCAVVGFCDPSSPLDERVQLLGLMNADRRLDGADVVLEPLSEHVVVTSARS